MKVSFGTTTGSEKLIFLLESNNPTSRDKNQKIEKLV